MPLTVAVQMDPIARIRIAGDSTFALLLEAQARGHRLLHYTPDRLRLAGSPRRDDGRTADGQGRRGRPCAPRGAEARRPRQRRRRAPSPGPAVRSRLCHDDASARAHPARHARRQRSASVRDAPEKLFVMDFPGADAADPHRARPRRDRGVPRRARRGRDEAALRSRRRARCSRSACGTPISARCSICSRSTFREPWVIQKFLPAVSLGDKRIILVDGEPMGAVNRVPAGDDIRSNMVRGGAAKETELTRARARDLRAHRSRAQAPRSRLRRHRRDRRLSDRNQRHLADRHRARSSALGGPDLAAAIWDAIEATTGRGITMRAAPCGREVEGEYSR